jgi:cell wall assembly regulator SMI1
MATIEDAITTLEQFLKESNPEVLPYLQPGLSEEQVANRAAALPFDLPAEVRHLFRWRNGTRLDANATLSELGIWGGYHVQSLEDAIEFYNEEGWKYDRRIKKTWFPLLDDGGGATFFVECASTAQHYGAVYSYDSDGNPVKRVFDSVTSLLNHIADGWEPGIYP